MTGEIHIILRRCALRHWRLAFRQQLVLVMILALGTGVYLAMRLANRAALSGFERFADGITRQSDWTVQGPGGPLDVALLTRMREALGVRPVHLIPMVEATVSPALHEATRVIGSRPTWRLLGLDFVGLLNLKGKSGVAFAAPKTNPHGVLVAQGFADREHVGVGDVLSVVINERVVSLVISGLIPQSPDMASPPDHLLVMDLPDAQRLLDKPNVVDRVEVIAQQGPAFPHLTEESGNILRQTLGDRALVLDHENKRALAGTMTAAFRLNLTILSLLALFVGGYLIFQALDGMVLRRREEIGILKSLGVTDRGIQIAFLIEAALLGIIGGSLGVLLGWAGAQGAVVAVTRTMNALYGATHAQSAALHPGEAAMSLGIAVLTSIVAAWWPAREAAHTPPSQMLGSAGMTHASRRYASVDRAGLALCVVALGLAQCGALRWSSGERWPLAGYAAAVLWLLGSGLVAGWLLRWCAIRAALLGGVSAALRVALSHLRRPSVRHRFAVAALASAVAMTAGMAVMVASFDHTMRGWVERSMKADIYVSSAGAQSASATQMIGAETIEALRAEPEVLELASLQAQQVSLLGGPAMVLGVQPEFVAKHDLYSWVTKPPADWWKDSVIINESMAVRFNLQAGATISIPTPRGIEICRIAGIYSDYGNERGSVSLPQSRFQELYNTTMAWRIAMMLKPGADAEGVRARLQLAHPGLSIFTQAHLREEALRIFRQTFSVTYALEVIGVTVAVTGLGLALASLLLERASELHTLRSLGMTLREIAQAGALEGLGVAGTGTGMGLVAGLWLGWLLIYRINKQCFGWTLSFHLPWLQLAALAVAVIGAGVMVSAFVARRIAHENR